MERGSEFINFRQSPEALSAMPAGDLLQLHRRLTEKIDSSHSPKGKKYLTPRAQTVARELRRRERLGITDHVQEDTEFPVLQADLSGNKKTPGLKGVIVEAHHDDISMFRLTRELTIRGVELQVVTLTDSSGRFIPTYKPTELDPLRWQEGQKQNTLLGVRHMDRISIPDGKLAQNKKPAVEFLSEKAQGADFIVAPHLLDPHADHEAAHEIALEVAALVESKEGDEIPVIGMDTITGFDKYGVLLVPDHYIPISRRSARTEKRGYQMNRSQVEGIPSHEIRDVHNVLSMTRRRGEEVGISHAAVLFDPLNTDNNPLVEFLEKAS